MKHDKRSARMLQIEEAAYVLIQEKGYASTSMLNIAKRAKASNETLYNWYGDKLGLFHSMVESNAKKVSSVLQEAIEKNADPIETLVLFGTALLEMLTGDRAVALNRAAAADASGTLGKALAIAGRDAVAPLIGRTLEQAKQAGALRFSDTQSATELYLNLLIGDMQLRCVTGQIAPPNATARSARAYRAATLLQKLLD
ncbi:TetR/AcrR family transcriptional regulator [uncultured Roseovarius sp.]|uniref:TetR/AcrR family transcriptional regulator n=1 Tax=uncultured Roseovarius sp. TaxID=293344 RepID=UPI00260E5392|nr:TetR/AcrR family transcriptional regulator [uncultured Roseovarius sp.]